MCPSSTRASSRSLAVWMALPRSGSRKYILRLMLVSSPKHDSPNVSYPAALSKSSRPRRNAVKSPPKLARQSLANVLAARGKSGLHRAGCWVTPRRRKATKRATETSRSAGVKTAVLRVKRGDLHLEQHQICGRRHGSPRPRVRGAALGVTRGLEE